MGAIDGTLVGKVISQDETIVEQRVMKARTCYCRGNWISVVLNVVQWVIYGTFMGFILCDFIFFKIAYSLALLSRVTFLHHACEAA